MSEMTDKQVKFLRLILQSHVTHKTIDLVKEVLPPGFIERISCKDFNDITARELAFIGAMSEGHCGSPSHSFFAYVEDLSKKKPQLITEYVDILFQTSKKRGFKITGRFRTDILDAIPKNLVSDTSMKEILKAFSSNGTFLSFGIEAMESGLSDEHWEVILRYVKTPHVFIKAIDIIPKKFLPELVAKISEVKSYKAEVIRESYDRRCRFETDLSNGDTTPWDEWVKTDALRFK